MAGYWSMEFQWRRSMSGSPGMMLHWRHQPRSVPQFSHEKIRSLAISSLIAIMLGGRIIKDRDELGWVKVEWRWRILGRTTHQRQEDRVMSCKVSFSAHRVQCYLECLFTYRYCLYHTLSDKIYPKLCLFAVSLPCAINKLKSLDSHRF